MFFVIVKIVQPDTHVGWSDINSKLENMNTSQFKQDTTKYNLNIEKWMNEIFIAGETYS